MPSLVLDLVALGAAVICIRGRVRLAALILLAALFLVPDGLPLSVGPGSFTVLRLLLWASTAGLVWRAWTGRVPWTSLRPGRVHLVLLGFVLMAYVVGVSWAPWPADFHTGFNHWLVMVDQLLFLWCAIAFTRLVGIRWMATTVVVLAAADAGIGVVERLTSGSYAHWWYAHSRLLSAPFAGPLERRQGMTGGTVRVRGNAEFALQYAWVLAMLTPLACALAVEAAPLGGIIRRRIPAVHWLAWLAPSLMVSAIVLSVSRSVFGGLAVGGAVWLVCSRFDRRVLSVLAVAGLFALALVLGVPSLRHPYHGAAADSIESRVRRQQFVAAAVVRRPDTGLGLAGLITYGITGTDSMYVLTYGTLGVVGLVGLAATLLTPLTIGVRWALRSGNLIAAGATAGLVVGIVAAGAFDSLSGPTSAWTLWLVAAMAVAGVPETARIRLSPARLLIPVAALAVGLVGASVAQPRSTVLSTFVTMDPRYLAPNPGDPTLAGSVAVNTACAQGRQAVIEMPVSVVCQIRSGTGLGYLAISANDRATALTALTRFDAAAAEISTTYSRTVLDRFDYRSTPWRTAPIWLGLGSLLLVLLVPPPYGRPRARPLQRGVAHA